MKWVWVIVLLIFFITPAAFAQYAFEITIERDDAGKCINWQDITSNVSFTLDTDGVTKKVFIDHPDAVAVNNNDLQVWFVDADVDGFYFVTFSFSGVSLTIPKKNRFLQYWFRYRKDGSPFSEPGVMAVTKPGKPVGQ